MIEKTPRNCQVKDYICDSFCEETADLIFIRENSKKEGLRPIHVPPNVGKMIYMLARLQKPKKILEIGTLAGYSTLWLALALSAEGKIITLENEERHVQIARKHFEHAGFQKKIEVRQGRANLLMQEMIEKKEEPFDLIFIDAYKENYPTYLELSLQLSRPGTLILTDNLIPKRKDIHHFDPRDNEAIAIYEFNQRLATDPRLDSTLFSTIMGNLGRIDALGVALVRI